MFDALAYPVSLVMKFWHWLLSLVFPADSGIAWVGSVILLVVTVRLILLRPMWVQMYSMRKMATLAPQLKEVQKKYKDDRPKQAEEMQRIYNEAQVNPLSGCLPMLVQIPVFIGLYHVLIGFTPPGMPIAEAMNRSNGAFSPEQVAQFLRAEFFGVPLASYIRMAQEQLNELAPDVDHTMVVIICVVLFSLAGIATYVNMRNSQKRQERAKAAAAEEEKMIEEAERAGGPVVDGDVVAIDGDSDEADKAKRKAADDKAAAEAKKDDEPEMPDFAKAMSESMEQSMKIMMFLFPIFPLAGGIFFNFPLAIGLYWLTNNLWTLAQSHLMLNRLEKLLPTGGQAGLPPSAYM